MTTNEPKKGYASLLAACEHSAKECPGRSEEYRRKMEWALERAQQYADRLGTDRETVLEAWEYDRDYWYMNYYQESNQPSLDGNASVATFDDWEQEGQRLYGADRLAWRFRCPACGNVQTMRQFKDAGLVPNLAYLHCASRHGLGGSKTCKWTIFGLLRAVGRYVIDASYCPRLIFEFADKEEKKED